MEEEEAASQGSQEDAPEEPQAEEELSDGDLLQVPLLLFFDYATCMENC